MDNEMSFRYIGATFLAVLLQDEQFNQVVPFYPAPDPHQAYSPKQQNQLPAPNP
jgi:hypothetical protein